MPKPAAPVPAEETPLEKLEQEYENTDVEEDILVLPKATPKLATAAKPVEEEVEETEKPAAKPKAPVHSPQILRMCKDLDITDEEIEGLTPEALTTLVSRESRRQLQAARQSQRAENEVDRRKKESQEEEDEMQWGEFEDTEGKKRKGTDEDVHPAILPVLKAQAKKIKELEAQLSGTKKVAETSNLEKFETAFDASCSRFKKTLGEGSYAELKGTPFTKKREVIYKEVVAIIQANKNVKLDDAIDQAVKEVYGVSIGKPKKTSEDEEEDEATKTRSAYSSGKTARPSGRKGKQAKGAKAAEDAVETWLNDNLGDPEDDDDPESEY